MKKAELYDVHMKNNHMESFIWDRWFAWKEKQAGVEYKDEGWSALLHSMPEITNWRPNERDQTMTIFWCENGEEQHEDVPLSEFYDDEQPDLEMLWHSNYYDGPLSGMAEYNGEYVWFNCTEEDDYGTRIFALHRLSEEDRQLLFFQHEMWRKYIGNHCDHHPDMYADYTGDGDFKRYEEIKKTFRKVDPTKGEKIGEAYWFQFKYWVRPRKPVDPSGELHDNATDV